MNVLRTLHNRKGISTLTQAGIVAVSFVLALIAGGVLLLVQGHEVLPVYYYLLIQPFSSPDGVIKVLVKATPLIFAGLSVAIAFKCDVFNIGVEGQLYAGALAAALLGCTVKGLPPLLHVLVCILGAMAVSGVLALIPAWLKVRFNVHEVISTIMMNYIINNVVTLIIVDYFRHSGPTPRTPDVLPSARMTQLAPPSQFNTGFLLAVGLCAMLYALFQRTPLGWRIDAAGKNLRAARYSGINSKRLVMTAMLISGALAGLLGAERVLGGFGYLQVNFSPGYGYDGIAIATIANNNPFGCLLMALLMGLLSHGGTNLNIMTDVPSEWVNVLSALIFVFVVAANAAILKLPALREKRRQAKRRAET